MPGDAVATLRPSHRPGHDVDAGHAVSGRHVGRAVAQREFPQHFPADGEVEHEPEDLWATTVETCRSALRQPYNVVTRWRSVSLGLYSCNGAALRVLSA